jgi:hypothetical protein
MTNTAEHLEHGEHAKHAAHDPFDRRVSMTMAIVAAVLAGLAMMSHRAHTDTLRLQSEASDKWNEFQANNIRNHEYQAFSSLIDVTTVKPDKEEAATKAQAFWKDKVENYKSKLPELMEKAQDMEKESHLYHERSTRFDYGELAIELALVLCSLAVLTKQRGFWYGGMVAGVVGLVIGLTAFTIATEVRGHSASPSQSAPKEQGEKGGH